jgi:GT2 family glycosyltransferase/glycosyltransferase involved in cell wall biosynthesis
LLAGEPACWIVDDASTCDPGVTAVVLDGALQAGDRGRRQLDDLRGLLAPTGILMAAVACARGRPRLVEAISRGASPSATAGFTRRSLLDLFDSSDWDVAALEVIRDRTVDWIPLPVLSTTTLDIGPAVLRNLGADDIEELTAEAFVVVARPRSPSPSCTIVLPVRGELALTQACIEALRDAAPAIEHEIVVVDDGSLDATPDYLAALHGQIRVLRNDQTEGFAAAANRGLRAATGEFVAVLHNDTIPAVGAIDALVDILRTRPGAGAAGPKLVAHDRTILGAGLTFGPDLLPYPLYRGDPFDAPGANHLREVAAVSSACLVTRRRWLVDVGGFDEALRGFEDADLCLRLRARGRPVVYNPSAVVVHREGGSPGTRTLLDDAAYFLEKWAGQLVADDDERCREDGTEVHRIRATGWYMPRRGAFPVDPAGPPAVLLSGQIFGRSGYANELRALARALAAAGVVVRTNPFAWPSRGDAEGQDLRSLATEELPRHFAHVCTFVALRLHPHPWAFANVGRTMWETDLVPQDRLERCLQMDEIWVPGRQQLELFAASGFPRDRLVALPATFDEGLYEQPPPPAAIEGASGFVFLSVFAWTRRKGWDVLVRAYVEEFAPSEDVTLVLAYRLFGGMPDGQPFNELRALVERRTGKSLSACPRIVLLPMDLPAPAMPSLYGAADAFVLPSRGEGWGRPLMEAMASGLPTIGTGWSGNLEFMTGDNSFLVDFELVDVPEEGWHEWADYRGQRWAEPSVADLRAAMRRVIDDPDEARNRAERGRRDVHAQCGPGAVAPLYAERLRSLVSSARES